MLFYPFNGGKPEGKESSKNSYVFFYWSVNCLSNLNKFIFHISLYPIKTEIKTVNEVQRKGLCFWSCNFLPNKEKVIQVIAIHIKKKSLYYLAILKSAFSVFLYI